MTRLVFAVLILTAGLKAAEPCPWLNSATASGFLGVSVAPVFTLSSKVKDDGSCQFSPEKTALPSLRIEVTTMANPSRDFAAYRNRCASNESPLRAIGNEAVACRAAGKPNEIIEQVVGRVRDRAFVIALTAALDSSTPADGRAAAHDIAEIVSGNLF